MGKMGVSPCPSIKKRLFGAPGSNNDGFFGNPNNGFLLISKYFGREGERKRIQTKT